MARSITSSVGKIGNPNMAADVRTVQEMLNNVDSMWGGPDPKLVVDGKTGPKLVAAIQAFQAENVGSSMEAGKVSPYGETLAMLNTYDPYPAVTGCSNLKCPHGGAVTAKAIPKPGGWQGGDKIPLTMTDSFTISGCPTAKPCVKVKWTSSPSKFLDARSVGVCLNKLNLPQGPVVIASV